MEIDADEMFRLADVARWEMRDESVSTTHHHHHHCDHQTTRTDHKNGEITCTCCGLIVDSILTDVFGNTIPLKNIKPHSLY